MHDERQPQQYCVRLRTNRTLARDIGHDGSGKLVSRNGLGHQTDGETVPYTLTAPKRAGLRLSSSNADVIVDEPTTPTPLLSGELMELDGSVLTLFRFATPGSSRPVIIDIPHDLCSPAVRGKLFDLLVAVEREEATRAARCVAAVGPALALLRDA
jgi:hypothetical protein